MSFLSSLFNIGVHLLPIDTRQLIHYATYTYNKMSVKVYCSEIWGQKILCRNWVINPRPSDLRLLAKAFPF